MREFNIKEMENYEINEIKDDLVILESQVEGTTDGDIIAKAFHYINYLEERLVDIANSEVRAKKLLEGNNYVIIKKSKRMIVDGNDCEKMQCNGEDKECLDCGCSICIMQYEI